MFRKILIANRGEIACRVIDTCRKMGVATVAVYSDADVRARHVAMADEAVHIGGSAPSESYLRGEAIIAATQATGAEAIHPGYGFLSENPDFVEAVAAAGLVFIGPSANAIRAMGLKDAAKALMTRAGVPVVPGYHGANQDDEHLSGAADAIGYPVLIKAVAGGGGKGMRRVERPADFAAALNSARSEARGAFGNDAVLIEKYIEMPRHIEVQIFGDGTSALHLFERDCSLQRRHQKVIEEAPAPGMTPEMRAAMGQAAVRAAEAIGYSGAGTVEFIVDASDGLRADRFWFMEMNTRLQVEHPVTEAITGVDLVEWQMRVAAGEGLWLDQADLSIFGHAFEARLYAEDVPAGFLPATGRLAHLAFPEGCRVETGVRAGDVISPHYDPMIAKVITHGPTRAVALNRLFTALSGVEVTGTITNLGFLRRLARHPGLISGMVDTGLIGRDLEGLAAEAAPDAVVLALAALGVLGLTEIPEGDRRDGFALWSPLAPLAVFRWRDENIAARVVTLATDRFEVALGDRRLEIGRDGDAWIVDGRRIAARVLAWRNEVTVFAGNTFTFARIDPLMRAAAAGARVDLAPAPMPGLIKAVHVAAGQVVAPGDPLVVLEAMKMEHVLTASHDGVVAEVLTGPGAQVEAGAALIRFEAG
jgi:3-methylcrotonyl-CoA carboxylase alpha subunit